MPSTFRFPSASAALTLLAFAMSTAAMPATTEEGCFSSSAPLKSQGTYLYQTSGYCQPFCYNASLPVMALSSGNECWCGNELPAASSKVSSSFCSTPCDGYDSETCGGNGYYQVYLSGLGPASSYKGSGSDTTSTSSPTQHEAAPSVTRTISHQTTVVIQAPTSAGASHSGSGGGGGGGGGGVSTAGIAAGVVVAVVAVAGAVAGLYFWVRHRKRKAVEEEVKRAQVAEFMKGGDRKPPATGYSSTSDSRLEPAFIDRRTSQGSIADNEDYSRKILRVANPDRSSGFPPPERISIFPPDRAYHHH